MNKELKEAVQRASVVVFEDLGFMLPTLELEAFQLSAEAESTVTVEFQGPYQGRLVLKIFGDVVSELTQNMLGQEDAPSEEERQDALGETANVICGNLLPLIAGKESIFHIQPPKFLPNSGGHASGADERPSAEVMLGLVGGRAEIQLYIVSVGKEIIQ